MEEFAAKEIGERIAEARRLANGMTQEQLGDLVGVSTRSIQDYEAGVTIPWKHMLAIARVTKARVDWLVHGSEEADPDTQALLEDVVARLQRIEAIVGQAGLLTRPADN